MPEQRLDAALAARGLARSRTHAATLIAAGVVTVDGRPAVKPALKVSETTAIEVAASDHYVSRAAHKLIAALDGFAVDPAGRVVLDAGASTGGFSQVLLERGARTCSRSTSGTASSHPSSSARRASFSSRDATCATSTATPSPRSPGSPSRPSLVTADLSFISLTTVLPALSATAAPDADFVLLVKPQFEVGRGGVREGVVRDAALRSEAVANVLWAAFDLGLGTAGVLSSPIAGSHGNNEYLVHLSAARGVNPTEWMRRVEQLTGGANA